MRLPIYCCTLEDPHIALTRCRVYSIPTAGKRIAERILVAILRVSLSLSLSLSLFFFRKFLELHHCVKILPYRDRRKRESKRKRESRRDGHNPDCGPRNDRAEYAVRRQIIGRQYGTGLSAGTRGGYKSVFDIAKYPISIAP